MTTWDPSDSDNPCGHHGLDRRDTGPRQTCSGGAPPFGDRAWAIREMEAATNGLADHSEGLGPRPAIIGLDDFFYIDAWEAYHWLNDLKGLYPDVRFVQEGRSYLLHSCQRVYMLLNARGVGLSIHQDVL